MISVSFHPKPPLEKETQREHHAKAVIETISWHVSARSHIWSPPTDFFETETSFVIRVEIAGMREQDFSIALDDHYLTISGIRPGMPERRAFHQMEIRSGEFTTVVAVPGNLNARDATAEYEDGFLTITLPKADTE